MVTIKIYLRTYKKDTTEGYIWVQFYLNREKINFTSGVKVQARHWIEKTSRVSKQDTESADKNLILDNILARINNVFVKYRLRDRKLTKEAFIRAYNRPDDYPTIGNNNERNPCSPI